ncbi:hypothetical protein E4U42_005183 [Claviceps africana]|uniref:Glycosyl transferase CAP10 domain-containing protein n=1 Tax=Claviceps africana TaxID=83212 RepID=A0A8K0NK86_9HYPO|nr:hypothetical protein E4U42_005183 [Claviceps africana]
MAGRPDSIDPAVWATWAAAGFCMAYNLMPSRRLELYAEVVCWTTLPLLFLATTPADTRLPKARPCGASRNALHCSSTLSSWIVATCVCVTGFCLAECNGHAVLLPILHPLFLSARDYVDSKASGLDAVEAARRPPATFVFRASLAALLCVVTISSNRLYEVLLSSISVVALLVILLALAPPPSASSLLFYPRVRIPQDARPLATHINALFCVAALVQGMLFGFPFDGFLSVIFLGVIKCATCYFTTRAAQSTSWSIAPAIWTYGFLSSRAFLHQPSAGQSCLQTMGCFLALGQITFMLPTSLKGRSILWSLFIFALTPHVTTQYSRFAAQSLATDSYQQRHPIQLLIQRANSSFQAMTQNQSQSYTAACAEYRRWYGIDPPPGFESWYNYARMHHSPIIDDFDTLYRGIAPFWAMSGREHFSTLFDTIAEDVRQELSNVSFLINHLDEPRVIRPHQASHPLPTSEGPPRETSLKRNLAPPPAPVTFVENTTASTDLCQHEEYRAMHGLFLSPVSFQAVEGSVPILSTGAVSTMGDILIPSPAYREPGFRYDAAGDEDWSRKSNNAYWAGSTTGGYGLGGSTAWRHFHRQRFVSLVHGRDKTRRHSYLQEQDGVLTARASSFLDGSLYDVSFTRIMQCDWACCRQQGEHFTPRSWADKDAALRSRLVFDVDGNGISGRYYKLLASQSTPLKQTLFREWHDDRLVPWVHYVPVSPGMEELAELVFFLTSTPAGQERARWIAEQGRSWSSRALREVDMSIYLYRLPLELARLQEAEGRPLVRR